MVTPVVQARQRSRYGDRAGRLELGGDVGVRGNGAVAETVHRPFDCAWVTPVKAGHFTELRDWIDTLRSVAGLRPFAWRDRVLPVGAAPVRLVRLLELRSARGDAYSAGRALSRWTDGPLAGGSTPLRPSHLMGLRAAAMGLE